MEQETDFRKTRMACYRGYIVQGIINNLSPLFFVIFQKEFGISYGMLSSLILFNFVTQIAVDAVCVRFADKIGYRRAMLFAHLIGTVGLVSLGLLPKLLPHSLAFIGLIAATILNAVGGGMLEVIVSPIIDSLPSDAKDAKMSLLHSFYCWGQVGVVLITTLAVRLIGEELWWLLPMLWAAVPLYNAFSFSTVPLMPTVPQEEKVPLRELCRSKIFLIAMLLMLCAGASELSMSQWSSLFAEKALSVPKVMGDLLGPCLFAVFQGIGRTIYGVWGARLDLHKALLLTSGMCVLCYLGAALFTVPILSLLCCALCGFSISLMWPGVVSSTSASYPKGGTAMFAVLAVCGDLGCSVGPGLTGVVSDLFAGMGMADSACLRAGMLCAVVFPLLMILGLLLSRGLGRKVKG